MTAKNGKETMRPSVGAQLLLLLLPPCGALPRERDFGTDTNINQRLLVQPIEKTSRCLSNPKCQVN